MIKIIGCLLLSASSINLYGQNSTIVSGGEATGTLGTISYTIGQVNYILATGSEGTVAQGLQQPFEILTVTGIKETFITLSAKVYPNPTIEYVTLNIQNTDLKKMSYMMFDVQGKLITKQKITAYKTTIGMSELKPGIYVIKILNNQKEKKTFKIIKNY